MVKFVHYKKITFFIQSEICFDQIEPRSATERGGVRFDYLGPVGACGASGTFFGVKKGDMPEERQQQKHFCDWNIPTKSHRLMACSIA